MRANLVIAAALGAAACGRVGFEAADGGGPLGPPVPACAPTPAEALVVPAEGATRLALCPGVTWLALDAAAGARLALALAPEGDVRKATITLHAPDEVQLARATWRPAAIETAALLGVTGRQLARIEADVALTATLTATVTAPPGRVVHIAPDGSDAADGSEATPWQTWPATIARLGPGDTLIVHDGAWTSRGSCAGLGTPCLAATPMPVADCTTGARPGAADRPITILARHPRRAHLASRGDVSAFAIFGCERWIVDGLHGSSQDLPGAGDCVFTFDDSPGMVARNLLAVDPNRCVNVHGICMGGLGAGAHGALLEDSEVYGATRAGVFMADSRDVTVRRVYTHSRSRPEASCSILAENHPDRGDVGTTCYDFMVQPSCTFENVISENVGSGLEGTGSAYLNILGSVALDASFGVLMQPSDQPMQPRAIDDFTCVNCDMGLWNRGVTSVVRGATLVGGRPRLSTFYGKGAVQDGPSTATWERVLALDNTNAAFELVGGRPWTITDSIAAGSPALFPGTEDVDDDVGAIRRSSTTAPTRLGDVDGSCLVYVPPDSTAAPARTGASIVTRTVGGAATDAKLWDQRTGEFPCGAIVAGVNDVAGASCRDVHQRLRVGVAGCAIP